MNGGVLKVTNSPRTLEVRISHLLWMKPRFLQEEIEEYWRRQGFAVAEPLPYEFTEQGLIVTRNIGEFHVGTGTLDERIDAIPF